jgi:hypothetical protein
MFLAYASIDPLQSAMSRDMYEQATNVLANQNGPNPKTIASKGCNILENISAAGLVIQQDMDDLGYFWHKHAAPCAVILMWPPYDLTCMGDIRQYYDIRGDEIMFPTLASDATICYAIGHPRALLNWSTTLHHAQSVSDPWPHRHRTAIAPTAKLVWWAQRINLKVYSAA